MLQITTQDTTDPVAWDGFLLTNPCGSIYQSTAYAAYCQKIGMKPQYIQATENGKIQAQLLLIESSRPFQLLYAKPASRLSLKMARKLFPINQFTYGPVCSDPSAGEAVIQESMDRSTRQRARLSGSGHPLEKNAALEKTGLEKKPWATFLIDVTQPSETLWHNVDKSARKTVNRTKEGGVTVRDAHTRSDLQQYLGILNEGRQKNNLPPYAFKGQDAFFDTIVKKGLGRIVLAEQDGRILAGLGITFFNGYVNEWGAGQSQYALEHKIYASDLIRWNIIEWAKQNGHKYYDLTGVNPNPQTDKEKGIYRFKEKWGGNLAKYYEYTH